MNAQVCTNDGEWLSLGPVLWNAPDASKARLADLPTIFLCESENCGVCGGLVVRPTVHLWTPGSCSSNPQRHMFCGECSRDFISLRSLPNNSCALSRRRSSGILGFLTVACKNPLLVCRPRKHGNSRGLRHCH